MKITVANLLNNEKQNYRYIFIQKLPLFFLRDNAFVTFVDQQT